MKNGVQVNPSRIVYDFLPNDAFFGMITTRMAKLTGCTPEELGFLGSSMYLDVKGGGELRILSKFQHSRVHTLKTGFGGAMFNPSPEFKKLEGYFYIGEPVIFDAEVDKNDRIDVITIEWHPDIFMAYMADVSLLDPSFKIASRTLEKTKSGQKKTAVSSQISVFAKLTIDKDGSMDHRRYDPSEIDEYFAGL